MHTKAVVLCGSHPRHSYMAYRLKQAGRLDAVVIEEREDFMPQPPEGISSHDADNFRHHFAARSEAESRFFGEVSVTDVPCLRVTRDELNAPATLDFVRQCDAALQLSYGVHKLSSSYVELRPGRCFNLHGGLSPWYRGTATLFWPFYMLRPHWAGMTFHRLTDRLDGGEILHQSVPRLEYGDRLHDVACKAVVQAADDMIQIFDLLDRGKPLICHEQRDTGRLFRDEDFMPQMLRLNYDVYHDRMVDEYLSGNLRSSLPPVVDFLKQA